MIERFSPRDTALVLVDVQNDFCHRDGSASRAGFDMDGIDPAVDQQLLLLDAARAAEIPVVFVRTTHDEAVDSPAWTHRRAGGIGPGHEPMAPNCVTGGWGAEFYRVRPSTQDRVVTKHRYSAFAGTELDATLRSLGRLSLLFAGFTTNVCVETSLRDALCRDYLVSIIEDACAAFDAEEHAASLRTIERYFGAVVDSDQLLGRWSEVNSLATPS